MTAERRSVLVAAVALLALGAAACGTDEPARDAAGEINETEDVTPNALQAGDCFNDPDDTTATQVSSLEAVPCDEPHDNEVFFVFQLDDGDFPGVDEVKELGLNRCEPELEAYVGAPAEEAGLLIVPLTPTEESWEESDDRTVLCALLKADGSRITGSLEGSGPPPS